MKGGGGGVKTTCYFIKDMDYEVKESDVMSLSRLCSELVYCKPMPVLPASIGWRLAQGVLVAGDCLVWSKHSVSVLIMVTVTVVSVM